MAALVGQGSVASSVASSAKPIKTLLLGEASARRARGSGCEARQSVVRMADEAVALRCVVCDGAWTRGRSGGLGSRAGDIEHNDSCS